jgi:hypothetical protein
MSRLGQLQHWLVIEKADGSRAVLNVHKNGGTISLVQGDGEPTPVARDRSVEQEVRIVYRAKIVRVVPLSEGRPSPV